MSIEQRERKRYRSVPLRTQAVARQRTRTTDAVPTTQASRALSHIPHTALPTPPDDDRPRAMPKSAWLMDEQGRPVVRRGNQQMVIHPPDEKPRRWQSPHWSMYVGVAMSLATGLFALGSWAIPAWQNHGLDATYGMPRTYQVDAVVGHNDSSQHPSHFIFENLHGHILIIELPGGEISRAHIYGGPTIFTSGGDQVPVVGRFVDDQHNGKPEMIVTIGTGSEETTLTFLNNGTLFVPQA